MQLFFIDSTAGRYVYRQPPEQKIITCCEADWNVAGAPCPRAVNSAQKHIHSSDGFAGTAQSSLRAKAPVVQPIAGVFYNVLIVGRAVALSCH